MKKFLFSVAILATSFAFGQITLEHSFTGELQPYINANQTFYYTTGSVNQVKIYNFDYSLRSQFNLPSQMYISYSKFTLTKNVFNNDDLFEIVVLGDNDSIKIYNENGVLIKDFGTGYYFGDYDSFQVFYNDQTNSNMLTIIKKNNTTEVYNLGTNSLTTKEVQGKNKLSAFPIPTNKILNIVNPENGINTIEIFDTNGKLLLKKFFLSSENKISIDVENLPKGIYFYKIGDLSSKFIKNWKRDSR